MDRLIGLALATVASIAFLVVLKSSVIALSIWFSTTWPEKTDRIYAVYRDRPWRCGLIGLVNTAVFVFIGLVLLNVKPLGLIGLFLILAVVCLHLWGRSAAHRRMAVKMAVAGADSGTPRSLVLGGLVTELTFLLPIIGQLLYLGTTLRAMGAVVVILLSRKVEDSAL